MTTILPFPPQDPPAPRAWLCHCGKRSVGVCCWNCRQPRPVGDGDGAEDLTLTSHEPGENLDIIGGTLPVENFKQARYKAGARSGML